MPPGNDVLSLCRQGFQFFGKGRGGQSEELRQNPLPLIFPGTIDGIVKAYGFDQAYRQFPVIFLLGLHGANPLLLTAFEKRNHSVTNIRTPYA